MLMEKKEWIDISKGIGIILVVMSHAINGMSNLMYSKYSIGYEFIYNIVGTFHMPLFFIISGYLYAYTTTIDGSKDYFTFIQKKLIALGIPYILFNVIYGIFGMLVHDEKYNINNLKYILIRPISHFWYVYILLLLFILMPALELIIRKNKMNKVILIAITICSASILYTLKIEVVYPLNLLFKYLPLFVLGISLCERSFIPRKINWRMLICAGFIYLLTAYTNNILCNYKGISFIGSFIMGSVGSLLLIIFVAKVLNNRMGFIGNIGRGSFEIYLIHSLFVSLIRKILFRMNILDIGINVICETIAGVLIPYALYCLSNKSILLRICFRPYSIYKSFIETIRNRKK